jgi:hypothetical protein
MYAVVAPPNPQRARRARRSSASRRRLPCRAPGRGCNLWGRAAAPPYPHQGLRPNDCPPWPRPSPRLIEGRTRSGPQRLPPRGRADRSPPPHAAPPGRSHPPAPPPPAASGRSHPPAPPHAAPRGRSHPPAPPPPAASGRSHPSAAAAGGTSNRVAAACPRPAAQRRGGRLRSPCHRRPRRVPLSAGSPVPRDPPAGAEAVLRPTCRGPRARVVKALAGGGAPEWQDLSGEGGEPFRVARCGSLSRGRSARHAR